MNENEIRKIVSDTVEKLKAGREMTLTGARTLSRAVMKEAERIGIKVVVCVSDAAGNPKLLESMDGAYIASVDVAMGKAYTVVALKMSTSKLKALAQPGAELYGVQFTNGGRIVVVGGGEPLVGSTGDIIGGLGVSGGSEAQDTALADFGKSFFETELAEKDN